MEHDSPSLLFRLACEHLASSRVGRPGVVKLLERLAEAGQEAYQRVKHLLTRSGWASWTGCEREYVDRDDAVQLAGQERDRGLGIRAQAKIRAQANESIQSSRRWIWVVMTSGSRKVLVSSEIPW